MQEHADFSNLQSEEQLKDYVKKLLEPIQVDFRAFTHFGITVSLNRCKALVISSLDSSSLEELETASKNIRELFRSQIDLARIAQEDSNKITLDQDVDFSGKIGKLYRIFLSAKDVKTTLLTNTETNSNEFSIR